ncbi:MAG TPA: tRNA pseudouridine(13) synthase TruD [Candidatus Nanoarchaeia archaeon]|nr:tRNA pseudouridine(13) synthase TruD [Candidatus Nanoarchaeia archaeon]
MQNKRLSHITHDGKTMILKQVPEDFIVQEINHLNLVPQGNYSCFKLKKKEWGTMEALFALGKALNIDIRRLGIAGMKDKRGVTEQYASAYQVSKEQLETIHIKNMEITFIGYLQERITLGQLQGNHFKIVVRDIQEQKDIPADKKILNLFDYQRFGKDEQNIPLGKALLQGNYTLLCEHFKLTVKDNNYIGALRTVNRRILRFILCAYQSHLWNTIVQRLTQIYTTVPVLGYLTDYTGEIKEAYEKLLQEEGVTQEDFKMKKIPELASEGNERKMYTTVTNLTYHWEKDQHHGNYKCTLEFDLEKGQYATHVVKTLFS